MLITRLVAMLLFVSCAPAIKRTDTIEAKDLVDRVEVGVVAADAAAGWNITVQNNRDTAIRLLWDESTYVTSTGESAGRLLRGNTRVMNSDREQPASPIPPHAQLRELAIPESHVENYRHGVAGRAAVNGKPGRLNIVFDTDEDGKLTWVGLVDWHEGN